jgi:HD-like signal output (HDOD) protein
MGLIDQPEKLEVGPVTEMVERDPIVIARLLHIVNSAYYGLRHQVSSAERAVIMLGPVAVAGIVVGMNMLKLRMTLDGPAAETFRRLTRHSVATAFITRHILEGPPRERARASHRSSARMGVSFTAGMLHDFGKIILVYNFPDEAVGFYDPRGLGDSVKDEDPRHLEQLLFGCDHCEAGEYVARKLNFPEVLTRIIALHHDLQEPTGDPETERLRRAVAVANCAAKAMGYAFSQPTDWETCLALPELHQVVRSDVPHAGSPEHLLTSIREQQEHLDQYVQHMSSTTETPPPRRRLEE